MKGKSTAPGVKVMSNPKIIIDKFGHNAAGMSKFGKGFSDKASIEKSVSRGDSFNAELSRRPERRDDYRSDQARLLETSVAATARSTTATRTTTASFIKSAIFRSPSRFSTSAKRT
jgi:hypothetical protein